MMNGSHYIYAVVTAHWAQSPTALALLSEEKGVGEHPLSFVQSGSVAAVTSLPPGARIRPERRYLSAHQRVVNRLLIETTPLPMAFGMIAGTDDLRAMLTAHEAVFAGNLDRVAGKVEIDLHLRWQVNNLFEYFLHQFPALREEREKVFGADRTPTHDQKMQLGRLFEHLHAAERDRHRVLVESALAGCSIEWQAMNKLADRDVLRFACLVPKKHLSVFDQAVNRMAQGFPSEFCFDVRGPWPPYHFVDVRLPQPLEAAC